MFSFCSPPPGTTIEYHLEAAINVVSKIDCRQCRRASASTLPGQARVVRWVSSTPGDDSQKSQKSQENVREGLRGMTTKHEDSDDRQDESLVHHGSSAEW